ncbi:M20 family metallopeptidase [soil metagenome]
MYSHLAAVVDSVEALEVELVALRRDLHAHPELAWQEQRTTTLVADRLAAAEIGVQLLPKSGLIAEVGSSEGPLVALRADLDALAVDDLGTGPWVSTVPGVAHACGHDVHTAALVGAGLALAEVHRATPLAGRVRLMFQPAEEIMPGGALELIAGGALDDVGHVFGLHCDPTIDVGNIGLREGPLTGAADALSVRLSGRGGHTSRPHLTEDLTYALAKLVTELPGTLSRRLDPRTGASLVWGMVQAGSAKNVIPASGEVAGTLRMLDGLAWVDAEDLVRELIAQILAPYRVKAEIDYVRGVPPVINEPASTHMFQATVDALFGPEAAVSTQQSLGGEDFAWYVETVPGAMGRLGTRTPGGPTYDLHQGDLETDERSVGIGAQILAGVAVSALSQVTDR